MKLPVFVCCELRKAKRGSRRAYDRGGSSDRYLGAILTRDILRDTSPHLNRRLSLMSLKNGIIA
jgi:hypothetical protein